MTRKNFCYLEKQKTVVKCRRLSFTYGYIAHKNKTANGKKYIQARNLATLVLFR